MGLIRNLCKGDKVVWVIFSLLCVISILEVFSASSSLASESGNYWEPVSQHCFYLCIGVGVVWVTHLIPLKHIRTLGTLLYPISLFMLAYIIINDVLINKAARWITILGFRFQPSELTKFSLIVIVAAILASYREEGDKGKKTFWYILAYTLLACAFIFRENLSTAVLIFVVVFIMMFVGHVNNKLMLRLTGIGVMAVSVFLTIIFLTPDNTKSEFLHRFSAWKERIVDFVTPINCAPEDYDAQSNLQVTHANIAIASSNFIGKMPGNSVERDYLSHADTDFIFAIIIEELGLLGGIFVLFLYIWLMIRVGRILPRCDSAFSVYLLIGVTLIIVVQAMMNMAVAVGLMPVTGQPLPLISRGGTSQLVSCIYIGIILNISRTCEERASSRKSEQTNTTIIPNNDNGQTTETNEQ